MKRVVLIGVAIILLVLENAVLPFYSFRGAYPSLLFVFAIAYSIINGKKEAVFIGIVTGFLQDIFFFQGFGINIFCNLLLCVLASYIGEGIFKQNRLIPVFSSFVISILKIVLITILLMLFNEKIDVEMSFYSAVMNTIVMFLGYKIVLTTSEKYITKDAWRFRW